MFERLRRRPGSGNDSSDLDLEGVDLEKSLSEADALLAEAEELESAEETVSRGCGCFG